MNVIINLSGETSVISLLDNLKDSIWWNHNARYVIMNQSLKNTCTSAQQILNLIWSFDILSAVYLCQNANETSLAYTFNPYSNSSPKFWNTVQTNMSFNINWILLNDLILKLETDIISGK